MNDIEKKPCMCLIRAILYGKLLSWNEGTDKYILALFNQKNAKPKWFKVSVSKKLLINLKRKHCDLKDKVKVPKEFNEKQVID